MTGEPGRLLRLGKAFEAQAKALKRQLLHLEQLRKSREDDLVDHERETAEQFTAESKPEVSNR